ncbi:DUF29 family protein [Rhizobium sp. 2YAF20]|uniref:DUF29 family protein n=1 Tax=Rhizobium sp. 2YAF20 TaxID=3233027 RepID=UPI003F9ACAFF
MSDGKYDVDFYGWTQEQAALLRALPRETGLDIENIAEEIEAAGRESINQLSEVLMRTLDSLIQITAVIPHGVGDKSAATSAQIEAIILKGQSVERHVDLSKIWRLALRNATHTLKEDGFDVPELPDACPLSLDQLLRDDFDPREAVKIIAAAMAAR